jgi:transposase
VRGTTVWPALLGVEKTVVERVEFDEDEETLVAHVRPRHRAKSRCGLCRRRCPGYDRGEGRRRWRALDLGLFRAFVEADAPRVSCPQHGVVVAHVPWARHDSRHTVAFDDTVAWLATRTSKSTLEELLRIAWRTVGAIVARVVAEGVAARDPLEGLARIGIDEISYNYAGDRCQGLARDFLTSFRAGVRRGGYEASSVRRSRSPSNTFWRPTCPFAAASSRWRCSVGRNSIVVTKNVQDSQMDSK